MTYESICTILRDLRSQVEALNMTLNWYQNESVTDSIVVEVGCKNPKLNNGALFIMRSTHNTEELKEKADVYSLIESTCVAHTRMMIWSQKGYFSVYNPSKL